MRVSENARFYPDGTLVLSVSDGQYALLISGEIWAHNQCGLEGGRHEKQPCKNRYY